VLGVPTDATDRDIRKAYYDKAKACHPDKHRDDPKAPEKFNELGDAYNKIKDAESRAKYHEDNNKNTTAELGGPMMQIEDDPAAAKEDDKKKVAASSAQPAEEQAGEEKKEKDEDDGPKTAFGQLYEYLKKKYEEFMKDKDDKDDSKNNKVSPSSNVPKPSPPSPSNNTSTSHPKPASAVAAMVADSHKQAEAANNKTETAMVTYQKKPAPNATFKGAQASAEAKFKPSLEADLKPHAVNQAAVMKQINDKEFKLKPKIR
jgi:curved DNA-binding protein CbpA